MSPCGRGNQTAFLLGLVRDQMNHQHPAIRVETRSRGRARFFGWVGISILILLIVLVVYLLGGLGMSR